MQILALLLFLLIPVSAQALNGTVVAVSDGDTITIRSEDGRKLKIRLYGIDTPEIQQAYGDKAKDLTHKAVYGKKVGIRPIDTDRYGRTVAIVYVNGQSVNKYLLQEGYAWVYSRYCKESFCTTWKGVEAFSRIQERGMWVDSDIIPPWEWRQKQRSGEEDARKTSTGTSSAVSHPTGGSPQTALNKTEHEHTTYHGNVSSRKFHRYGCKYYDCKNCTQVFDDRASAIAQGYTPCGICRP